MMLDPAAIEAVLRLEIQATDFWRPVHQALFPVLTSMHEADRPIDTITLTDELRDKGILESSGGTEYLMALVESVPTAANVTHYAGIVREQALLRQALKATYSVQELIRQGAEPKDVVAEIAAHAEQLQVARGSGLSRVGDLLNTHYTELSAATDRIGLGDNYTTGFSHLDTVTGGWGGPVFAVLKAHRGQGKTHHLIQATVSCLRAGHAAAVFSMDTPKGLMLNRYLAHLTGLDSRRIRRPRAEDWSKIGEASAWLYDRPLYVWWDAGITPSRIRAMCKAVASQETRIGLIGIDYAELLGSDVKGLSREQELSGIAQSLKNLRDEMQTTVLLLSQTNKQGGERWSEGIGNAGDLILTWEMAKPNGSPLRDGELWTEKNRLGPDVTIGCVCDPRTSRIREQALDYLDPTFPPSWPWWYCPEELDFEPET